MSVLLVRFSIIANLVLLFASIQAIAQPPAAPAAKLEFNQVIKGKLTHSDSQVYEVHLNKGQYLEAVAVSEIFLPQLVLVSPEEQVLIRHQPFSFPEKSRIVIQVEQTADYKLVVSPENDLKDTVGHYELSAKIIAEPDINDLSYSKMLQLQEKYWPLYSQGTIESLNELIKLGTEILKIARSLGNRQYEGLSLIILAEAHKAKEEYDPALAYFKQTLIIAREWSVAGRIAGVLTPIGQIYYTWGDYPHALENFLEALSYVEKDGDPNIVGWNLTNIGHVYFAYGELTKAIPYYQRAYEKYGHYAGSNKTEKPLGQGIALASMANVYSALGEKQKAIDLLKEALEHIKATKQANYENIMLVRLGDMYTALGDYEQAEIFLERACQYFRASNGQYEASALSSRGNLAKLQGDFTKALTHLQNALTIRRNLKDKRGTAQTLTNIGAVYALQGNLQNALNQYAEANLLWQELGDKYNEGRTLNYLGQAYAELKNATEARGYLTKSLALRRVTNDREGEANTLYQLARLDFSAGNSQTSRQQIKAALAIAESVRATVNSKELRATYLATVKEYYEFYIELLMQMHRQNATAGFAAEAFKASEMARARNLSETLTETRQQLRPIIAPELIKQETELQQRLNAKAEYQQKLVEKKAKAELLRAADQEVSALTTALQEVRTRIQSSNPHYAELAHTEPIAVTEIQQSLLDENTLLLAYALGKDHSYLWAISKTQCNSYELPKREIIEASARRVYELLIAQNGKDETALLNQATSQLSQMILAPINEIVGQKRLLVIADGALQYIPFAMLPETVVSGRRPVTGANAKANRPPLIVNHEIINLPSATALAILRRGPAKPNQVDKTIAVFADPVFASDDPRLINRQETKKPPLVSPDLEQSLRDVGENYSSLRRLVFSRREAQSIDKLVTDAERKTAIDFDANRAMVLNTNLQNYRILHFATHGLLNSVHPELSGLVFSLVDEKGQPQDGFFRLHEIYNLQLNTDLVVLSACQTALGKEIKGEGLISLTRGFMYAGAPRVIASLWKVNDRATAELMSVFYQEMLGKNKLSAAAALRAAQISQLKQPRWLHPRYWAAFTLQGEWK